MRFYPKVFSPAGRIIFDGETVEHQLHRLARAALPRFEEKIIALNYKHHCYICGESISSTSQIRHFQKVCDDCAAITPRLESGRCPRHKCAGCLTVMPRRNLKMKDRKLYCKKCLKIKFHIDF